MALVILIVIGKRSGWGITQWQEETRENKTKNVELLIKTFAQLDNTDANLIIAGPDYGELPMLKNLVQKLKIEN